MGGRVTDLQKYLQALESRAREATHGYTRAAVIKELNRAQAGQAFKVRLSAQTASDWINRGRVSADFNALWLLCEQLLVLGGDKWGRRHPPGDGWLEKEQAYCRGLWDAAHGATYKRQSASAPSQEERGPGAEPTGPNGTLHGSQRADASTTGGDELAAPDEFIQDLTAVLQRLDEQARTGRLPPYLQPGADVADLARTVRTRPGVRSGKWTSPEGMSREPEPDAEDENEDSMTDGVYGLPADRREELTPPRRWPDVAAKYPRLMVLADPGLGKSWLIRTETHRLAAQALVRLGADSAGAIIPVPIRCDQLAAAPGPDPMPLS